MKLQKPKGTQDILPAESAKWQYVEGFAREIFKRYNYAEVRTPIFEHYEVISRSVGDTTDIVTKEMYDFYDKGDRHITLRPEGTAPVVRSYVENKLFAPEVQKPSKFYYMGPMFRYERPQAGRLRQFHQIDCELLGSASPLADADVISLLEQFITSLGIGRLTLRLNSLGCSECRPKYREALIAYLEKHESELCEDCQRRLHTNPLRVLDCKKDSQQDFMKDAPRILDYNCPECREHYETVTGLLKDSGIAFVQDDHLVRGLDYYCRTTFELQSDDIGAQTAVAGGGRYDGLIKSLGGPDVPGVGFACGMERLALLMKSPAPKKPDFYTVSLDPSCYGLAYRVSRGLRLAGLTGELGYASSSMKAAMRQAGKSGARYAIIIGSDELARNVCAVKNMDNGNQEEVAVENLASYISTKD